MMDAETQPVLPFVERCPFDVLWMIMQYLDRNTLRSMYLANRYLNESVTPLMWTQFTLETHHSIEERFDAALRYDRARHIRSCRIQISGSWPDAAKQQHISNRRIEVLLSMKNLKRLDISASTFLKDTVDIMFHALSSKKPFQLHSFNTNIVPRPSLEEFILTQTDLRKFEFAGRKSLSLTPAHLPNLSSIRATANIVEAIVPNRPVEYAYIEGFVVGWRLNEVCSALSESSRRLQHLRISLDTLAGIFGNLHTISLEFGSHLRSMELGITGVEIGNETGFWAVIGTFARLEWLTLLIGGRPSHQNFLPQRVIPNLPSAFEDTPLGRVVIVDVIWYEYARASRLAEWALVDQGTNDKDYPQYAFSWREGS